jgi:glycosyltransferase involved in cell wall biosynthesis
MKRKLKILFLNHNVIGEGTFLRCYHLARKLVRMDCEVDLSCTNREKGVFRVVRRVEEEGFRLLLLPEIADTPSYPGCAGRSLVNLFWLALNRRNYDLIHAFSVAIPSTGFAVLGARWLGVRRIFIDWDDKWGNGLGTHLSPWAHRMVRWCERTLPLLVKPSGMTVVSDFLQQECLRLGFGEKNVVKIINGADTENIFPADRQQARKRIGLPAQAKILVSMGRMYDQSLEVLLAAFEKVLEKLPRARLYVVGDLCHYGDLEELIRSIKWRYRHLGENVVFAGGKPYPELNDYLAAADALVLPMHDSASDRARFPMRVGDYLASGRPVASNAVGEVKRIFRENDCALLSDAEDIPAFAGNIVRLLGDRELGLRLAGRALRLCRSEMDWGRLAAQLLDHYQSRREMMEY